MAAETARNIQDRMENSSVNTMGKDYQSSIIEALSLVEDNPTYHNSEARVTSLISIWTSVSDKAENLSDLSSIFHSLFRKTSLTILSAQWVTVNHALKRRMAKVLSQCSQVLGLLVDGSAHLCAVLVMAVYDPWGEPALRKVMGGEADINDSLVRDYLDLEPVELLLTRIESLAGAGYEEAALCLSKCCVKYSGDNIPEVEKKKNSRGSLHSSDRGVRRKGGIIDSKRKEFLRWFLVLLQRRGEICQITKETASLTCHEGVQLIRCVNERNLPDQISLAETLSHAFLVRDLIFPSNYCCTKELITLWCKTQVHLQRLLPEITAAVQKLLVLYASTSAHFYLFVDVLWNEFGSLLFPFYLEMYIRGLTADLNYLELARQTENYDAIKELESHIADVFTKLSSLFTVSYEVVARECVLSAFSLKPTQERLDLLQALTERISHKQTIKTENQMERNVTASKMQSAACSDAREIFPMECRCGGRCSTPTEEIKILHESNLHQEYIHPVLHMQIRGVPYELMQDFVAILECFRSRILTSTDDCEKMKQMCGEYLCRESIIKNSLSQVSCESADSEADSLSDDYEVLSQHAQKTKPEDCKDNSGMLVDQNVPANKIAGSLHDSNASLSKEMPLLTSVFAKQKLKSLKKKRFLKEKILKHEFMKLFKLAKQNKNVGKDDAEFVKRKKKRKTKREKDREVLLTKFHHQPLSESKKLQKKRSELIPSPPKTCHQEITKLLNSTSDINFGNVVNNNARVLLSRISIADMEKASVSCGSNDINSYNSVSAKALESGNEASTSVTSSSQLLASCISSPTNPVVVLSDILSSKSSEALKIMSPTTVKSLKFQDRDEGSQNNTGSIRLLFKKELSAKVKNTRRTVDNFVQVDDNTESCKDGKEKESLLHTEKFGVTTSPTAHIYSVSQVFQNKSNPGSNSTVEKVSGHTESKPLYISHELIKRESTSIEVQQNSKSSDVSTQRNDFLKHHTVTNMATPSVQHTDEAKSSSPLGNTVGQGESISGRGNICNSPSHGTNLTEGKTVIPIPVNSLEAVNLQHFSAETGQNKPPVSALKLELPSLMQNRSRVMTAKLVLPVNSLNSSSLQSLLRSAVAHSPNSSGGDNSANQTLTIPGMIIIRNNYSSGTSSEDSAKIDSGQEMSTQPKSKMLTESKRLWTSVRNLHGSIEWRKVGQRSCNMGGQQKPQSSKPYVTIMQVPQHLGLEATKACDPLSGDEVEESLPKTRDFHVDSSPAHLSTPSSTASAEVSLTGNDFETRVNSEMSSSSPPSVLDPSPPLLPVLFAKAKVNTSGDSSSLNDTSVASIQKLTPYRSFKQSNTLSTQTEPSIEDTSRSDSYAFRKISNTSRKTSKPQIIFAEKCTSHTLLGTSESNAADLSFKNCSSCYESDSPQKYANENSLNITPKTCSTVPQSSFLHNSQTDLQKTSTSSLESTLDSSTNKTGTISDCASTLKHKTGDEPSGNVLVLTSETEKPSFINTVEFASHNKDDTCQNRKDKVVESHIPDKHSPTNSEEFVPPIKRRGRPRKSDSVNKELITAKNYSLHKITSGTSDKMWENEIIETSLNYSAAHISLDKNDPQPNEVIWKSDSEMQSKVPSVGNYSTENKSKECKTQTKNIHSPQDESLDVFHMANRSHTEFNTGIKQFEVTRLAICPICKKVLSSLYSLNRHRAKMHKETDNQPSEKYLSRSYDEISQGERSLSNLTRYTVKKCSSAVKNLPSHHNDSFSSPSLPDQLSSHFCTSKIFQPNVGESPLKYNHLPQACSTPGNPMCTSNAKSFPAAAEETKFKIHPGDNSIPDLECICSDSDSFCKHNCTCNANFTAHYSDALQKTERSFIIDSDSNKISQPCICHNKNCMKEAEKKSFSPEELKLKIRPVDSFMEYHTSAKKQCSDTHKISVREERAIRRCQLNRGLNSSKERAFGENMPSTSYQNSNQTNHSKECANACLEMPDKESGHVSDFTRGRTRFSDAKKTIKRPCPCCEDVSFSKKCITSIEDGCHASFKCTSYQSNIAANISAQHARKPRTRSSSFNT